MIIDIEYHKINYNLKGNEHCFKGQLSPSDPTVQYAVNSAPLFYSEHSNAFGTNLIDKKVL